MIRICVYTHNGRFCAYREIQDDNWIWYISKPFIVGDISHDHLAAVLKDLSHAEPVEIGNKDTAKDFTNEVARALGLRSHPHLYKKAVLFCFEINGDAVNLTLYKSATDFKGFEEDEEHEFPTLKDAIMGLPM